MNCGKEYIRLWNAAEQVLENIDFKSRTVGSWAALRVLKNAVDYSREWLPIPQQPASEPFTAEFDAFAKEVNRIAVDKGWWEGERNNGELIALMHSELSEALEALRHGNPPDDKIPEFSGVEAELADVIIRIMDMAAARGYRVGEAVVAKIVYNRGREYKHGGKRF